MSSSISFSAARWVLGGGSVSPCSMFLRMARRVCSLSSSSCSNLKLALLRVSFSRTMFDTIFYF